MTIESILEKFLKLGIKVAIGFEFEFYLLDKEGNPKNNAEIYIEKIHNILYSHSFFGYVEKENSIGQLEISSIANFNIIQTTNIWNDAIIKIKEFFAMQDIILNHDAKPFLDKAGNGLHINVSLHDIKTHNNLFAKNDQFRIDIKNQLIAYSIGGLLSHIKANIDGYLHSDSLKSRIIHPDRNTPTNFSWGQNNRTTMIRIPESLQHAKRIENRLPSSENNLNDVIILTLEGVLEGITEKIEPQECTYGLSFDEQYKLKKII